MTDNVSLWQPEPLETNDSLLADYIRFLAEEDYGNFADYDDLWQWSVTSLDDFWSSIWEFGDIIGERGPQAYAHHDDIRQARFFPQALVNYAENMLRYEGGEEALIAMREDGKRWAWSHDELHAEVSRLQQALTAQGIGKGDRVAGFVPNTPQAVAFMLATSSVGAIWSSCSPDFGFAAAMDRLSQIEPKILVSANGYYYGGKRFSSIELAQSIATAIPSIGQLVIFDLIDDEAVPQVDGVQSWDDFIKPFTARELTFEPMAFDDPLYIMFSSGTTGLPKCIVHSVGGTLLNHKKELLLHGDVKERDKMFYFTTCGWMMWNWSISALMCGASLLLFDGSPFYPKASRLPKIMGAESVTHFGTSAKFIDGCAKLRLTASDHADLSALRLLFSTGSPLSPAGFDYIYDKWKQDLCLASIAGGTDILGCFVGGSPISPVYRGACQKRLLGMAVEVFDDAGRSVVAEKGELVCTKPHPAMPVSFWHDADGSRYHKAYFARYDNIWHHGDCVALTKEGGMIFYGRSDATLNPGGVRIGTAEIYRQVEAVDEVLESVVIGQHWKQDVRVVLFVTLREGVTLTDDLKEKIKIQIRQNATPRHVPSVILSVADIPRTKSGKITELAVRDIVEGKEIGNVGALANPEALAHFKNRPELS